VIRGGANYYRRKGAARTFHQRDTWRFHRARRYAKSTHGNKPWPGLVQRYWGKWNKEPKDRGVFGDKRTGRYLRKFGWFRTIPHARVRGRSSPDDARLREYGWSRRSVNARHRNARDRKLASSPAWTWRVCGMALRNGEELQRPPKQPKAAGGGEAYSNRERVPVYGHQQETYRQRQESRQRRPADECL
jgi:RNA-directed DNA polymerase